MKILRVILYICGALFLGIVGLFVFFLVFVDPNMQNAPATVTQTMSVGGKTVHMISKGDASFSATNEGDEVVINGKKLDLTGGDEFTVEIDAEGNTSLRPGKP